MVLVVALMDSGMLVSGLDTLGVIARTEELRESELGGGKLSAQDRRHPEDSEMTFGSRLIWRDETSRGE